MSEAPSRFWMVRDKGIGSPIVAKFDTAGRYDIPDEIADYDGFVVQSLPDRSAVESKTVDHGNLTEQEKELLDEIYPTYLD